MLWEAEFPVGFWAAALQNAAYFKNRSPTSYLRRSTGNHPAWDTYALPHAHVPSEIRSKTSWDSHTTEGILNGHLETENMYELWDITKGEGIRRRDVIFWEDILASSCLRAHALPRGMEFLPIANSIRYLPYRFPRHILIPMNLGC